MERTKTLLQLITEDGEWSVPKGYWVTCIRFVSQFDITVLLQPGVDVSGLTVVEVITLLPHMTVPNLIPLELKNTDFTQPPRADAFYVLLPTGGGGTKSVLQVYMDYIEGRELIDDAQ